MKLFILTGYFLLFSHMVLAQSIAEKKAGSTQSDIEGGSGSLQDHNQGLSLLRCHLEALYKEAGPLYKNSASEEEFQLLLGKVNEIKARIATAEDDWRQKIVEGAKKNEEGYGLWDQEDTTLAQLIMEYGASDYLYIIPPEITAMKLSMHSGIPIPRESWDSMLELILSHNGIGIKKINAYARQLYILKQDPASIKAIANRIEDLQWIPSQTRLFYVFSPPVEQIRSVFQFFERFSDPKLTNVYLMGNRIIFVTFKEEVEKLIALYNAVWEAGKGKVSRVISASKMSVKDMEKILHAFFVEGGEKIRPGSPMGRMEPEGVTSIILPDGGGLVLVGQREIVDRAEKMIRETENQLEDPSEMTVHWYTCKHSDPLEVAEVLEKVYSALMVSGLTSAKDGQTAAQPAAAPPKPPLEKLTRENDLTQLVVQPPPALSGTIAPEDKMKAGSHFIPYPKTGLILMVIRRDALDRIKEILRKIDVPKKMVQIEVLLFEKKLDSENNFGLNLLRIGSEAENVRATGAKFNGATGRPRGLFEFLMSRKAHHGFPAFDLAYNFLMTQENVRINAAPSVITVNQTAATISIVDEISINNGAAPVQTSNGEVIFEKSYTRAQYGITIVITPTIHLPDSEGNNDKSLVTLETNITFDTPKLTSLDDRPDVPRRHIETEVRVVDGQTLILGGLRRKLAEDKDEKIPFLGELPGLGKLFGFSRIKEQLTEMFIFITPRVINDPVEDIERLKLEELKKRPGDLPEFLQKLKKAREKERQCLFERSFKLIFGNQKDGW